jgi:hypothetical protein
MWAIPTPVLYFFPIYLLFQTAGIAKILYAPSVPHPGYTCNLSPTPILTTVEELYTSINTKILL